MGNPALTPDERFSYRHYRTWPDSERWELLGGRAWAMSPAPSRRHQKLVHELALALGLFLKGKPCEAYEAPFDVLLPEGGEAEDEVETVVQPDISVFCDPAKLTERGARGAPDLVVEVLSPSTSRKDQNEKFRLYERHGVREYWIADPNAWSLWVYRLLDSGSYDAGELRERLGDTSPVASRVLVGLLIDPLELFAGID